MFRTTLIAAALAAAFGASTAVPAAADETTHGPLTIADVWARPTIPNRPSAAYARIANAGAEADRLVSAASPAFETIELHTVEKDGDVMKMLLVEAIEAPAGGSVSLAPGGYHLMLFGAAEPLEEGDSFPLTLTFEKAGEAEVTVQVMRRARGHGAHGHGSHSTN